MKTIIILIATCAACAAQIVLPQSLSIDGKEFSEVTYISHDAARVKFSHDSGMASVEIAKMPEEIRAILGYDPSAAAERATEQAAEDYAMQRAAEEKRKAAADMNAAHAAHSAENLAKMRADNLAASIAATDAEIKALKREIKSQSSSRSPEAKARYERLSLLRETLTTLKNQQASAK